jgi:hypothetical protein
VLARWPHCDPHALRAAWDAYRRYDEERVTA